MQRRTFLQASSASLALTIAGQAVSVSTAGRPQRILVLGGTNYVGPAVVERALARGHEVTLFNRGITRPELFPGVEKLRGERHVDGGDLRALAGTRRWDAVIDVWPAESRLVEHTARLLADRSDYYFFCSTIGVYRDFSRPGLNEQSPVHEDDPGWYGGEKALAEKILQREFEGRAGISRCQAILGPRDDGSAYHYWLRRLALSDEVLAPGSGDDPMQYVDVRDVATWMIDCVETRRNGTHNLTGPEKPWTLRQFLETTRAAIGSDATLTWANADFLRQDMKLQSFTHFPLWAPLDEDEGFYQIDGSRAIRAGLRYRPLEETARDAWRWYQAHFFRHTEFPHGGMGMSREREADVLAQWKKAASS